MMRYTATQLDHAYAVTAECHSNFALGDPDHRMLAADIALTVCLVESDLLMYANTGVPASLTLPHDAVWFDVAGDSLGLFGQRTPSQGPPVLLMNAAMSAAVFLHGLLGLGDWAALGRGQAARAVQRSGSPDRFWRRDAEAVALRKSIWDLATLPTVAD